MQGGRSGVESVRNGLEPKLVSVDLYVFMLKHHFRTSCSSVKAQVSCEIFTITYLPRVQYCCKYVPISAVAVLSLIRCFCFSIVFPFCFGSDEARCNNNNNNFGLVRFCAVKIFLLCFFFCFVVIRLNQREVLFILTF